MAAPAPMFSDLFSDAVHWDEGAVSSASPAAYLCRIDPRACLSRTGYVIFYANCPIIWQSKLQTTIALSTTEAEYVALLTAMRDVIYFMNLIDEMKDFGIACVLAPAFNKRVISGL